MPFKAKTYTNATDEELMHLIGGGHKGALNELYGRYQKKLLFFMYKLLQNDPEKARDILQDIFIQIIEKPGMFDASQKFSTWVYTNAKNRCFNYNRDTTNRARILGEAGKQTTEAYEPNFGNTIDGGLFNKEMQKIMPTLTEKEQLLLTLRFQQELPIKEIAQIMQIPEGTVKSGIFYLLQKIAKIIPHFNPKN